MKYRRTQEAEVKTLSCPFDTTIITSGDTVEVFSSVPTRKLYKLAKQLQMAGKVVSVYERMYLPKRQEGWEEVGT